MTKVVQAVYECGILRPLESVDLREKEHIYVLLLPDEPARIAEGQRRGLEALIGNGESTETDISIRHDQCLYGPPT